MGLDMYLERMPRYKDTTPREVNKLEDYFRWKAERRDPKSGARKYSFEKWTGIPYKEVPNGLPRKFYKQFSGTKYYSWDKEKNYPYVGIIDQVGYWRKSNEIHNWFVENVQDGVDDCCYHDEVTRETLEELLDICKRVLASCELVDGKVKNGERVENGQWVPIMEDGKYVKDPSVAEELLPCVGGFFFGSTAYDEWYVKDIEHTIDIVTKVLETTDFETQMVYYVSSW